MSALLGERAVAETSSVCWRGKRRTENGMQQETVTFVKKTKTIVNATKAWSSIFSERAFDQLPGFSGCEEENALATKLFVGGLSQLDSPSFTGVNKVLTIAFVT